MVQRLNKPIREHLLHLVTIIIIITVLLDGHFVETIFHAVVIQSCCQVGQYTPKWVGSPATNMLRAHVCDLNFKGNFSPSNIDD